MFEARRLRTAPAIALIALWNSLAACGVKAKLAGGHPDASAAVPIIDSGEPDDAGEATGLAGDAGPDGGGVDASGPAPSEACLGAPMYDLDAIGSHTASTTAGMGRNVDAPAESQLPLPSCQKAMSHAVVFKYTPRTTTQLFISTNTASTTFDTVLWVLDQCGGTASELACNDDAAVGPRPIDSTLTVAARAGTPIMIAVGGYDGMNTQGSTGAVQLIVTEQTPAREGAGCDPAGRFFFCTEGAQCAENYATHAGRCITPGAREGVCTIDNPPCDAGLVCSGNPASLESRCVPSSASGMTCDPTGQASACEPGDQLQCVPVSSAAGRCEAPRYTAGVATGTFFDACAAPGAVRVRDYVTDTGLLERDDGHPRAPLVLPFPFTFYGVAETHLWPDVNGYAVFGARAPLDTLGPSEFPERTEGPVVAPLWQDLALRAAPASDICAAVEGTAPNRRYVVEWLDVKALGGAAPDQTTLTFELVLSETTNTVDFFYRTATAADPNDSSYVNGQNGLIGVQSALGVEHTRHLGAFSLTQGLRFTP